MIPDGCCDLIIKRIHNNQEKWLVSDLSQSSYFVPFVNGDEAFGLRLKPGTWVNRSAIGQWAECHELSDLFVGDRIDEFCHLPVTVTETLDCLKSESRSITDAAKELGISTRTLQREVKKHTGRSPYFWFSLARARRTCRSLPEFDRLTDVAAAFGFSDQAHMTREVVRWFGVTPSAIKAEGSEVFTQLQQSGYG
ncbi:MAG: helix-turn-helix domain-containing protein [Burkholderiaceae bacterium]